MKNHFILSPEIIREIRESKQNPDLIVLGFDDLSEKEQDIYLANKRDIIEFKLDNQEYPEPVQSVEDYMNSTKYIVHLADRTIVV